MGLIFAKEYNAAIDSFNSKGSNEIPVNYGIGKYTIELKPGAALCFFDYPDTVLSIVNKGRNDFVELTYSGSGNIIPVLEDSILHFHIVEKRNAEPISKTVGYVWSDIITSIKISRIKENHLELMNSDFLKLYAELRD